MLVTFHDITRHLPEQRINMIEPLGVIDQADMVVSTGEQGIQEQRVNILFKFPAVHLYAELVTKHERNGKGIIFHILLAELFRNPDNLLQ